MKTEASSVRRLLVVLCVVALVPTTAFAQKQARMRGVVKSTAGQPIVGATIVLGRPDMPSYKQEIVSGEGGAYQLVLADATRTYSFRVEAAGFLPLTATRKVPVGAIEEVDFTMAVVPEEEKAAGGTPAVAAFNAGAELYNQGDTAGAQAKFEEALALDPLLLPAHLTLARLHLSQRNWAKAAAEADAVLAVNATDPRALRIRWEAARELGDDAKVEQMLAALRTADPKIAAQVIYIRANALFDRGQVDEARKVFEEVVTLDAENARGHYKLGICLISANDAAGARAHLEKFIALAPEDPEVATAKEMLSFLK